MLSCIPAVVQRAIVADAACESVFLCLGRHTEPLSIPLRQVQEAVAANEKSSSNDSNAEAEWKLLYDVIKVEQQQMLFEQPHMDRIQQSYHTVTGTDLSPANVACMRASLERYIAANTTTDSPAQNVKLLSWLPAGEPPARQAEQPNAPAKEEEEEEEEQAFRFVLLMIKSFFPPAAWYDSGTIMGLLYNAHRENPSAKVVQAGLRARAKALQEAAGVFEVLLVHDAADNYLIPEGSRSNYLLLGEGAKLLCSTEEDILVGITLKAARRAAERAGLGVVQHQKLNLKDLCDATSLVMLGTSPGALPVREVLLYQDAQGKAVFEAAAAHCGIDLAALRVAKKLAEESDEPKASLHFEVHNAVVDGLMQAYHQEAIA